VKNGVYLVYIVCNYSLRINGSGDNKTNKIGGVLMARGTRVRVPTSGNIFYWFCNNFGIGGFTNYEHEQIEAVLNALYKLLYTCGPYELWFIGKVLLKLADYPELQKRFLAELDLFK